MLASFGREGAVHKVGGQDKDSLFCFSMHPWYLL